MLTDMRRLSLGGLVVALAVGFASSAMAIPVLQIYIDGASYDSTTETWITTDTAFDLWVIGDVGSYGTISDLKLSAAVATSETGTITLTPGTASVLTGITDPSAPIAPTYNGLSADGAIPVLSDGTYLPTHGIYGPGTSFHEWALGDLMLTDSPIGDFISAFPSSFPSTGQVNVYTVNVTGYTQVHFDAYDSILTGSSQMIHAKFAPLSHDGGLVPEPSGLVLFSAGLLVVGYAIRRR